MKTVELTMWAVKLNGRIAVIRHAYPILPIDDVYFHIYCTRAEADINCLAIPGSIVEPIDCMEIK